MEYIKLKVSFKERLLFLFAGIIHKSYLINTTDTKVSLNKLKIEKVEEEVKLDIPEVKWHTEPLFFNENDIKVKSNL